jgi:hypothetical protein
LTTLLISHNDVNGLEVRNRAALILASRANRAAPAAVHCLAFLAGICSPPRHERDTLPAGATVLDRRCRVTPNARRKSAVSTVLAGQGVVVEGL